MDGSSRGINPLHTVITPSNQSGFSALSSATPVVPVNHPGVFRLPQPVHRTLSSDLTASNQTQTLSAPITFDIKGGGGYGNGFAMRDLCARTVPNLTTVMENGEDRVFENVGESNIIFRILWPGYTPRSINIDTTSDQPMTRAQIGRIIAQEFAGFIEDHQTAISSEPAFGVSESGVCLEHLFLLSLQNTCDDSWQADVVVDMRTIN